MIAFGEEITTALAQAGSREWLETNGLGGFASSTIAGMNTRRYHGLLFAATRPPVGRLLMLSKLEETVFLNGSRFELSTNRYPGTNNPEGYKYLKAFRLDPFPIFTFEVEGLQIEKSIFMLHGENTTIVEYAVRATPAAGNGNKNAANVELELRPLIAFRDYHSTAHENADLNPRFHSEKGLLTFIPYSDLPPLYLGHNAQQVEGAGYWYRNFEYAKEIERGFDDKEDLFNPCVMRFNLSARSKASVIASTERHKVSRVDRLKEQELERRKTVVAPSRFNDPLARPLVTAADQFIVARGMQRTVIAGYHWFGDWGRDTMIALPGLTLLTGRIDVAQSILAEFARYIDHGMLPNRFPDNGELPEYNTVDATLWFFDAVRSLTQYSGDFSFVRSSLYDTLVDIIEWHQHGTRYGIKVDDDGLLHAGEEGVQLTWMDAKVGDWVVTPRTGKPVEIQALWYNALRIMSDLAQRFGDQARSSQYAEMAERARASFNQKFWNESDRCLYDVVDDGTVDPSIRPNQIFAVSLHHTMLEPERARAVVEVVQRELLTPFGLRSLSPKDPKYVGKYEGGPMQRDGAYHQGTVWAWLAGPFMTAYVRVNEGEKSAREQVASWLQPFSAHLREEGLGQISEIFEGDAPHKPCGCIAQAWSVAEVLRATLEEAQNFGHLTWQTREIQGASASA
jgi:predicted glycogen debranching enzyme